MKAIELTQEQKSKLLEMCNILFPEYKEIVLTKHNTLRFGYYKLNGCQRWIGKLSIHWFEFCIINLCYSISQKIDLPAEIIRLDFLGDNDPIQYLYSKFKQIKK